MPTLRDIRQRIRSVQSTQKITRAMKLVAAAKFRRAQERIVAARPYASKMAELLGHLVASTESSDGAVHPLLEQREGPRRLIVIITADKGLAGAFNANIIRRALEFIRESNATALALVVVGRKARDFYRRRPFTIKRDLIAFWDRLAYSHAAELADYFMAAVPGRGSGRGPPHLQRVPLRRRAAAGARAAPARSRGPTWRAGARRPVDYIYEPSPEAILGDLLPRHVRTQVYRALMESLAGEYGARMTAMEAATQNAKEMIDVLTIQYNKARQERITKELLDIVGGAEALKQQ